MMVSSEEPTIAGVRVPIVAKKPGNAGGAKGAQEGGYVTDKTTERRPAGVPEWAKQAGETQLQKRGSAKSERMYVTYVDSS